MEKDNADWSIGDTCVLVVSIPKRYTQEFEVKGFDGKYYTLKHGNSIQHAAPVRMFRTKEEALTALDTGNYPTNKEYRRKNGLAKNDGMEEYGMNRFEAERRFTQRMKDNYPPGTRLELINMNDPYAPVPSGTRGTVQYVDDIGQIGMKWDNGRSLSIVPGEDSFRRLTEEELAEEQKEDMDEDNAPVMGM